MDRNFAHHDGHDQKQTLLSETMKKAVTKNYEILIIQPMHGLFSAGSIKPCCVEFVLPIKEGV